MPYDMQASGYNSVGSLTLVYANSGWSSAEPAVLWATAAGPGIPGTGDYTGLTLDGMWGWGNGNGSGVVGVPGANRIDLTKPYNFRNVGVYGAAAGPNPAVGVVGEGGSGSSGVVGYGGSQSSGVVGIAGSGNADGMQGYASGNNSGVAGFGAPGTNGNGVYGEGGDGGGPGVYGLMGKGGFKLAPPTGVFGQAGPIGTGVEGHGSGSSTGVAGIGDTTNSGNSGIGVLALGGMPQAGSSNRGGTAVHAIGGNPGNPPASGFQGYAGEFFGDVNITGNFTVMAGAKSVAVPFPDGSHRRLYCMESPENWFEDFGFGELSNGEAKVQLDEGFRSVVNDDAYHVFITEYEDNNGLYVAQRRSTGFLVRTKGPQANGQFSYRVVAKRKDLAAPRFDKVELPTAPALQVPTR
jgi:hypothetical protein